MNSITSPAIRCTISSGSRLGGCFVALVVFLCGTTRSYSQGTIHITFDGPPAVSTISPSVQNYFESGILFRPLPTTSSFLRKAVGSVSGPYNGTAYIQPGRASALGFSFTNGAFINLATVDLAENDIAIPNPVTVEFIGYRFDGTIVTTNFTTDGIIDQTGPLADFQTFHFDSRFSDLLRVEIPNSGWSLDNLVVTSSIPEPSSLALCLIGGSIVAHRFFRRRKTGIQQPG